MNWNCIEELGDIYSLTNHQNLETITSIEVVTNSADFKQYLNDFTNPPLLYHSHTVIILDVLCIVLHVNNPLYESTLIKALVIRPGSHALYGVLLLYTGILLSHQPVMRSQFP